MLIDWSSIATRCIEGLIAFAALGLWTFCRKLYRDLNAAFTKIRNLEAQIQRWTDDEEDFVHERNER